METPTELTPMESSEEPPRTSDSTGETKVSTRGAQYCSVTGCHSNTKVHRDLKFYRFPTESYWNSTRRKLWIIALNRRNSDGSRWQPSTSSRICSVHFQTGARCDDPDDPDYVPNLFPVVPKKPKSKAEKAKIAQRLAKGDRILRYLYWLMGSKS